MPFRSFLPAENVSIWSSRRWSLLLPLIAFLLLPWTFDFLAPKNVESLHQTLQSSRQLSELQPEYESNPWMIPASEADAKLAELTPRDIEDLYISQPLDLTKRDIEDVDPNSQDEVRCYMEKTLPKSTTSELCPSDRWPTSLKRSLGRHYFGVGTKAGYLQGCTVLIAVKDDILYIAHYWEVPGFSAQGDFPTVRFEQEVINYIKEGKVTTSDGPTRADPALNTIGELKGGADVWILTIGSRDGTAAANYPSKIQAIRDSIRADDALGSRTNFHERYYARPGGPRNSPNVYVLFEYSPSPRRIRFMYTNYVLFDLTWNSVTNSWQ